MSEKVARELVVNASREEVWETITADGWLADDVELDLRPGGEAVFRSPDGTRQGWIEDVCAPARLTFWWGTDDEPASRVEIVLREEDARTRVCVTETRPLEVLDLVGIPLPGAGGPAYGPALVAA